MIQLEVYEALRTRPHGPADMLQTWSDLLFLHFPADPEHVQRLLPDGLTVDTFPDDSGKEIAWIGLVPFDMSKIRQPGMPAFPWLSAFPETNVRTYVHLDGKRPGVWFFSLDAARLVACSYARQAFALNYLHANMAIRRRNRRIEYTVHRLEDPCADLRLAYEIGEPLPTPQPGSFEFWLVERYLLYSQKNGRLYDGQVAHEPYRIRSATLLEFYSDLVEAAGVKTGPLSHICYSPGVNVEVFNIRPVGPY